MMTDAEVEDIISITESWRTWGLQFGWCCYGCRGADSAGFHRIAEGDRGTPFEITANMRRDIDAGIEREKRNVWLLALHLRYD